MKTVEKKERIPQNKMRNYRRTKEKSEFKEDSRNKMTKS